MKHSFKHHNPGTQAENSQGFWKYFLPKCVHFIILEKICENSWRKDCEQTQFQRWLQKERSGLWVWRITLKAFFFCMRLTDFAIVLWNRPRRETFQDGKRARQYGTTKRPCGQRNDQHFQRRHIGQPQLHGIYQHERHIWNHRPL